MESKKINKKFNSIFWSVIYALPLIFLFLTYFGYLLVYKETGSTVFIDIDLLNLSLSHTLNSFNGFIWDFIFDMFNSLFESLSFDTSGLISLFVVCLFTWLVQFSFIHILVDVLLFIPRALHNFMERWS